MQLALSTYRGVSILLSIIAETSICCSVFWEGEMQQLRVCVNACVM
jgi:hypothetical protein